MSIESNTERRRPSAAAASHLRPWGAMEMLDRTVHLLVSNFTPMALLAMLSAVATVVAVEVSRDVRLDTNVAPEVDGRVVVAMLAMLILQRLASSAAILFAVQKTLFPERRVRAATFLRTLAQRFGIYFATSLLLDLVLFMLISLALQAGGIVGILTGILTIYLAMSWALAYHVSLVENRFLLGAMSRSSQLMSRGGQLISAIDSPRRRLVLLLSVSFVVFVSATIVWKLVEILLNLDNADPANARSKLLSTGFAFVIQAAVTFWWQGAGAMLYAFTRIRHEGLDLELRLAVLSQDKDADDILSGTVESANPHA